MDESYIRLPWMPAEPVPIGYAHVREQVLVVKAVVVMHMQDLQAFADRDQVSVNVLRGQIGVADVEAEAEFELQKQIYEAEELVAKKMWPEARAMLESLRKDMPEQIDVLRLLSQTYKGLGLDDKAAKLDAQIAKLKQQQNAD